MKKSAIIEKLNGKAIKVYANSISIYESAYYVQKCGVITNATAFKYLQPREKFALKEKYKNLMQFASGLFMIHGDLIYLRNNATVDAKGEEAAAVEALGADSCGRCFIY